MERAANRSVAPGQAQQKVPPRVSVVVASHEARDNIEQCLGALQAACEDYDTETIVVDNSSDGTADYVAARFPSCMLIRAQQDDLVPRLWETGIRAASGEILAITTAHFIPQPDWIGRIVEAHGESYAGVGGGIENDPKSGPVSWAIYFCRYSPYMLPFEGAKVHDFAGDNASYKRAALERYETARRNGFWEAEVHARMVADGLELFLSPRILVSHRKSYSFVGFVAQRFFHGRQFGSERASRMSPLGRVTRAIASPLVPFVMLFRVGARVLQRKRHAANYLVAAPILLAFFASWAAGELVGFLVPTRIASEG